MLEHSTYQKFLLNFSNKDGRKVTNASVPKKRNFHRVIVKTNSSSLSQERLEVLRKKIYDPKYISFAIEKLSDNISKAMLEGYIDQRNL